MSGGASDSRSLTLAGDWLEATARSQPQIKDQLTELNQAAQKKLWHQVAQQLLSFLSSSSFPPSLLQQVHEHVVTPLHRKLSPFEYARWVVALASHASNAADALTLLQNTLPHVSAGSSATGAAGAAEVDEQAVLLLQLEITRRQLQLGDRATLDGAKERLAAHKAALDRYSGVMDARVYAAFYQASYEHAKLTDNPQEYYANSLLYLTYTPLASLPAATQAGLASDIGLAALLGKNIYNFGELLQHPILQSLDATEYAWLPKLLHTFNQGDISQFNTIFADVKNKYPALAANAAFLNQKLRIMTLMDLVFRLGSAQPASGSDSDSASGKLHGSSRGRVLTFEQVAAGCDLPLEQVEWLLMKALALRVVKGELDEVAQQVRITWVAPRVLDMQQLRALKGRLDAWQREVEQTTIFVENNAAQVI